MSPNLTASVAEEEALRWFEELNYAVAIAQKNDPGLPVAVIELKNAADADATVWTAFHQLQTYKKDIPSLFRFNELLVISDGLEARVRPR